MYINNPARMTMMAAMPIYGKNTSKIFFSGTDFNETWHEASMTQVLQCTNVYINHDPAMTLTYLMGKSEHYGFFENYCSLRPD